MKRIQTALLIVCALLVAAPASAQLNLNSLKNKAKNAVKQEVSKQKNQATQATTEETTTERTTSTNTSSSYGATPAKASHPDGPPRPKLLTMYPSYLPFDSTDSYQEEVFWMLRDRPFKDTKAYADTLTAWVKWARQMVKEMNDGTRPLDYEWRDDLEIGIRDWEHFYSKIATFYAGSYVATVDLKPDSQGQWSFKTKFPDFQTGLFNASVPVSQVDPNGRSTKNTTAHVSFKDEKRPFRFGEIVYSPSAPPYFQPYTVGERQIEVAKRDCNMALNAALLLEGYPIEFYKDEDPATHEEFDIAYHKALFFYEAVREAIANNGTGKIDYQPMPKAGKMHASMKSKVLAVDKAISKDVVDVVITSDNWEIERNALGQPIRRVLFGYSIVQTKDGKVATRVSWAEEHQGGGKYSGLHAYGNGTESFLVK